MNRLGARGLIVGLTSGLVLCMTLGCGRDDGPGSAATTGRLTQTDTTITYRYIGPSTAPQFHREYIIVFEGTRATARIGGYGVVDGDADPAKSTSTEVSAQQWKRLVDGATTLGDLPAPAPGCVGGSTYGITVTSADRMIADRTDLACGSSAADVAGRYDALIADLRAPLELPEG